MATKFDLNKIYTFQNTTLLKMSIALCQIENHKQLITYKTCKPSQTACRKNNLALARDSHQKI